MDLNGIREVRTEQELREVLGPVMARAATKDRARLHPVHEQWLAASPFCLVATSAADGTCDVSPKGDPAGFTVVLDESTLALPERPGNRRGDGFHNILSNPHVGLIYVVPGRDETLRINGRARIVSDAPFFERMRVAGHRPKLALLVEIEQIFFHCAKAFMRAGLWKPKQWEPELLPSFPEISHALQSEGVTLEQLRDYYGERYADKLYREAEGPGDDPPASAPATSSGQAQ